MRALAKRSIETLRGGDVLDQISGEEFADLLPGTGAEKASQAAERLRRQVAEAPVDLPSGALRITACFGICSLNDRITTVDEKLAVADKYLYFAKTVGRNRSQGEPMILPAAS